MYIEQVFKMYGGSIQNCVLEFDKSPIGIVYDKFGEDVPMLKEDKDTFIATVKMQVSPTFWGWLFQFADKMEILSPDILTKGYKEHIQLILK